MDSNGFWWILMDSNGFQSKHNKAKQKHNKANKSRIRMPRRDEICSCTDFDYYRRIKFSIREELTCPTNHNGLSAIVLPSTAWRVHE